MSITQKNKEISKRNDVRIPIVGNILYTLSLASDGHYFFEGVTTNISMDGACIHVFNELEKGLNITIHGKGFGDNHKNATVKWCKKIHNDIYRAGLFFF
jgi:hypothetical protein